MNGWIILGIVYGIALIPTILLFVAMQLNKEMRENFVGKDLPLIMQFIGCWLIMPFFIIGKIFRRF